jgi:hypothetical protein
MAQTKTSKTAKPTKNTASTKKTTAPESKKPSPNSGVASQEQLTAIRDLLFGQQVAQLESTIEQQNAQLNERLDGLEKLIHNNQKTINSALETASQTIESNLESAHLEHVSQEGILEDKLEKLDNLLADFQLATEQNFSDAHKSLSQSVDEINQSLMTEVKNLTKKIELASKELGNNKADRKTLATLLESMATNLTESQA